MEDPYHWTELPSLNKVYYYYYHYNIYTYVCIYIYVYTYVYVYIPDYTGSDICKGKMSWTP